jgi:molybdopterin-guanine dinucleotide biosynthesis protein A
VNPDFLLPIVLAGGQSLRFGRNKLIEPLPTGEPLVTRAIASLRAVFGHRVLLAGGTQPALLSLGDGAWPDQQPRLGPMGAIVTGLRQAARAEQHGVFVLAGDMPGFDATCVRTILSAAAEAPEALGILACEQAEPRRTLPCAGLYRTESLAHLERALSCGHWRLRDALPPERVRLVPMSPEAALNVNTPEDLARLNSHD